MTALGARFPVFCNETDFKHRFASLVEGTRQGQHVRAYMEYRYNEMGNAKKYYDQKGRAIEMHSDITVYLGVKKRPSSLDAGLKVRLVITTTMTALGK